MIVKGLDVCKVTPSPGSDKTMCLPLTFFDLLWLRSQPVEYLFFYEDASHPDTFFSSIIPKLKNSLSQTLQHFLPEAGNLIWECSSSNPVISYKKGDGVLVTIAQSDADFFHLSSNDFREANVFSPLVANINESDSQVPLIAVKATLFPNKGFCIGITFHHAVFDGKSFTIFMKAWTSLSKLGESRDLSLDFKPKFDRLSIRERYQGLEKLYVDALLKKKGTNLRSLSDWNFESQPNTVRCTFQLSGSDVKRLKEFVLARSANHTNKEISVNLHVSTFTIGYAYLMVCLVKEKKLTQNMGFSIVVDCRDRLEPPISANYFGNCLSFIAGDVDREKLIGDDGIIAAVCSLSRTIKSLDDGVLKGAETWLLPDTFKERKEKESTIIYLAGSTRLEPYEVDYGWGRPTKVGISSIDKTRSISLMKGRDGDGGVEIELCLGKEEMEKFASAFAEGITSIP